MSNPFVYLLADSDRAFFQQVAEEQVPIERRRMAAFSKTAAPSLSPLEKFSGDLDGQLAIVRACGPIGLSMGMTKRAAALLGRLADDAFVRANPAVVPDLINKVAAEAVDVDVTHAIRELCQGAPAEDHAHLRAEVCKIAFDLVTSLEAARQRLEKEAGLGLAGLSEVGSIAKKLRGAENLVRGSAGAAEGGLGRLAREWRARKALNARAAVGQVGKELQETQTARKALEATRGQKTPLQFDVAAGKASAVAKGQEQQYARARAAYAARRGAAVAKSPAAGAVRGSATAAKGTPSPAPAATSAPPATPPPSPVPASSGTATPAPAASAPSSPRAEAEKKFSKITGGKFDQGSAAPSPKVPRAPQKAPEEAAAEASAAATPAGLGGHARAALDSLKKLHSDGWSSLAPHEKKRLITGGVGLVGAHRLLTGRDLVTGEKGE
jgi:hypothetical protein